MFHAVTRARTVVALAGRRPLLSENADQWLIRLRWIALAGMLGTTLFARVVVPRLDLAPLLAILATLGTLNVVWGVVAPQGNRWVAEQLTADIVAVAALLWFSGGAANPFAVFLTFQLALAGVLCPPHAIVRLTVIALVAIVSLLFAVPIPWASAVVDVGRLRRAADLVALAGVGGFMGFSAYVYGQRLQELRTARERNDRLAVAGRLAGGIAHELNTPLATILLASEELVHAGREVGSDEVARLSETLATEARRASDVIELLRGRVRIEQLVEPIDASKLVAEVVLGELDRLAYDGARDLDLQPGVLAFGSRAALQQILTNLTKNAVEAVADFRDARIGVSVADRSGRIVIQVRDNGGGIEAKSLSRIGEPFQTTKEQTGGSGLGLYVCSVLAEQMKAQLQIESHEGEATTVTLSLRKWRGGGASGMEGMEGMEDTPWPDGVGHV